MLSFTHRLKEFMILSGITLMFTSCSGQPLISVQSNLPVPVKSLTTANNSLIQTSRSETELLTLLQIDRPDLLDGLNLTAEQNTRLTELIEPQIQSDANQGTLSASTVPSQRTAQEVFNQALQAAFISDNFDPDALSPPVPGLPRFQTLTTQILAFHQLLNLAQREQFLRNLTSPDPAAMAVRVALPQNNQIDQISNALSLDLNQKSQLENILQTDVTLHQQAKAQTRSLLLATLSTIMPQTTVTDQSISQLMASPAITPSINHLQYLKEIHAFLTPEQRALWVEINGNALFRTGFGMLTQG